MSAAWFFAVVVFFVFHEPPADELFEPRGAAQVILPLGYGREEGHTATQQLGYGVGSLTQLSLL